MKLQSNPRIHIRFVDRKELLKMSITYPSRLGEDFIDEYKNWRQERCLQTDNLVNRLRFMRLRNSLKDHADVVEREGDSFE